MTFNKPKPYVINRFDTPDEIDWEEIKRKEQNSLGVYIAKIGLGILGFVVGFGILDFDADPKEVNEILSNVKETQKQNKINK